MLNELRQADVVTIHSLKILLLLEWKQKSDVNNDEWYGEQLHSRQFRQLMFRVGYLGDVVYALNNAFGHFVADKKTMKKVFSIISLFVVLTTPLLTFASYSNDGEYVEAVERMFEKWMTKYQDANAFMPGDFQKQLLKKIEQDVHSLMND